VWYNQPVTDHAARADREGVGARCLLWLPPGYDAPLDLLDGLRQRRVPVREVRDAPAVMAELAAGWANVLVIVEPKVQRHGERLVEAVRRYHPRCVLWAYRYGENPPLQRWVTAATGEPTGREPADDAKTDSTGGEPAATETPARPATRETAHPPVTQVASEAAGPGGDSPEAGGEPAPTDEPAAPDRGEGDTEETDEESPLLTEAELEMLLGDEVPPSRRER